MFNCYDLNIIVNITRHAQFTSNDFANVTLNTFENWYYVFDSVTCMRTKITCY